MFGGKKKNDKKNAEGGNAWKAGNDDKKQMESWKKQVNTPEHKKLAKDMNKDLKRKK